MEEQEHIIILYDYYGELFSDIQRRYFEAYYFDNLSLSEIAENEDKSRNAVHKSIKSVVKKLYEYVPKNDREKIFLENIFKCLSYKMPDIKIKPRCNIMNEVAGINYGDDSNVFNSIVDDMIDNEIECNPDISKKKIKKLRVNVRNSIPRKNALFSKEI